MKRFTPKPIHALDKIYCFCTGKFKNKNLCYWPVCSMEQILLSQKPSPKEIIVEKKTNRIALKRVAFPSLSFCQR